MWRDNLEIIEHENVNFLLTHGAIGDMITSLPAVVYARRTHTPALNMNVWAARYQVELIEHLIGRPGINVLPLDEFRFTNEDKSKVGTGSKNCITPPVVTRNRFDLVDYAYATLLDLQCEADWQRCYPHKAPLGDTPCFADKPYVVFPTGATNAPSVMQPELLAGLIEWAISKGFRPVLVGKSTTDVVMYEEEKPHKLTITDRTDEIRPELLEACLDLRDKTTLMELRDICGYAVAVVGIDGGTLHLAGTTEVPIVYGCTRVDPKHRSIVRHNEKNWKVRHVTPRNLECAGCQSHWTLKFSHDFSKCIYGDALCSKQLCAEDFIKALEELEVV